MKKALLIFIILATQFNLQSQTTRFNRLYKYHVNEPGNQFNQIVNTKNGYITFGYYAYFLNQTSFSNNMAARIDSNGNLINWIPFADTNYNYFLSYFSADNKTVDGGYILSGSATDCQSPNLIYGFLMKLDSNLNIKWKHLYKDTSANPAMDSSDLAFNSLKTTPDKGFIVAGNGYRNNGHYYCIAEKFDSLGNLQWFKKYNTTNCSESFYNSVVVLPDGYALGGSLIYDTTVNSSDEVITKVDNSGNVIWQKIFGGREADGYMTLQKDLQGNIFAFYNRCDSVYYSSSGGGNYFNYTYSHFLKLNPINGDSVWSLSYGALHNDVSYSFRSFPDGSALASGSNGNAWLLHMKTDGTIDWYKEYSLRNIQNQNNYFSYFYDLIQTKDKGFAITGIMANTDTVQGICGWILKVDEHGCLTPNCDSTITVNETFKLQSSLEIYPNPASSEVNVNYFSDMELPVLEIYNMLGIKVMEKSLPKNTSHYNLNISKLVNAYYKIIIKDNGIIKGQTGLIVE